MCVEGSSVRMCVEGSSVCMYVKGSRVHIRVESSSVCMCVEGSTVCMCAEARAHTSLCRSLLYLLRQDLSPQNSLIQLLSGLPESRTPHLGFPSITTTSWRHTIPAFLWMLAIQTPCPQTCMQTVLVAFPSGVEFYQNSLCWNLSSHSTLTWSLFPFSKTLK